MSDSLSLALMLGSFHPGGPSKKKKSKKKKKTYSSWFEGKCTQDELKQLCRAAKLPVSGTKGQLAARLVEGEFSSKYSEEWRVHGDNLKEECRQKGLQVSGKRFDLVLRLLQNETGAGGEPKRAAGEMNANGEFQPKKRAKSMNLPNVEKLTERAYKKAFPPDEVRWRWSNYTSKEHCGRCINLAIDIIKKEVFEKELFDRGEEELAWKVIDGVTRWFVYGLPPKKPTTPPRPGATIWLPVGKKPRGIGYATFEIQHNLYPLLIKAIQSTSSKVRVQEFAGKLLRDLEDEADFVDCKEFSDTLDEYLLPDLPKKRYSLYRIEK